VRRLLIGRDVAATADTAAPAPADETPVAEGADFDPTAGWRLHPAVAVRPEPFGALVYHYGTRRLTFLKQRTLTDVVCALQDHPSVEAAIDAVGVGTEQRPAIRGALARLAATDMLVPADGQQETTP
jgi:putative mycofactocin binding protein MftB